MPIHKSNKELKLYYAVMNEDGSYGELIPLEGKIHHIAISDNGDVEIQGEEI